MCLLLDRGRKGAGLISGELTDSGYTARCRHELIGRKRPTRDEFLSGKSEKDRPTRLRTAFRSFRRDRTLIGSGRGADEGPGRFREGRSSVRGTVERDERCPLRVDRSDNARPVSQRFPLGDRKLHGGERTPSPGTATEFPERGSSPRSRNSMLRMRSRNSQTETSSPPPPIPELRKRAPSPPASSVARFPPAFGGRGHT